MNDDVKGGLILLGSTLTAALFIAGVWTSPASTGLDFIATGFVVGLWTIVNLFARSPS